MQWGMGLTQKSQRLTYQSPSPKPSQALSQIKLGKSIFGLRAVTKISKIKVDSKTGHGVVQHTLGGHYQRHYHITESE